VNDIISRDYNFSVRLSQQERRQLEQLSAQLNIDKSAAMRLAVRLALARLRPLPTRGCFVALGNSGLSLPMRLSRKVADEC
jgi:hypothetical protein